MPTVLAFDRQVKEDLRSMPVVGYWREGPWKGNKPPQLRASAHYWSGIFDVVTDITDGESDNDIECEEFELGITHAERWLDKNGY